MTNAEKIKNMTDKELYQFLNNRGFCPYVGGCENENQDCKRCLKKYLDRKVS